MRGQGVRGLRGRCGKIRLGCCRVQRVQVVKARAKGQIEVGGVGSCSVECASRRVLATMVSEVGGRRRIRSRVMEAVVIGAT